MLTETVKEDLERMIWKGDLVNRDSSYKNSNFNTFFVSSLPSNQPHPERDSQRAL